MSIFVLVLARALFTMEYRLVSTTRSIRLEHILDGVHPKLCILPLKNHVMKSCSANVFQGQIVSEEFLREKKLDVETSGSLGNLDARYYDNLRNALCVGH